MAETGTSREWIDVAEASAVADGEVRTFQVPAGRVAVACREGQLFAVQDLCTHDDGPLGEGELDGYAIVCPRHGAKFDVRTGAVLQMPAIMPIETFPVMEKDGRILVGVPEEAADEPASGGDW